MTGIVDRLEKKGLIERMRKEGDRRVTLIILTDTGKKLGVGIPDPIEKKFINQLADLELEHVQLLAMAMNQILNLIDAEDMEAEPLDLNPETLAVEAEEIRH
jgi:DNA-binding MarR family transcriptional regulator